MKEFKDYGMAHIGFVVKDREKTLEHLNGLFGFTKVLDMQFKADRAWYKGQAMSEYKLNMYMAFFGDNKTYIEIIEPITDGTLHMDFVNEAGEGIHHAAFMISDIAHWRQYFLDKGMEILIEAEVDNEQVGVSRYLYLKDPETGLIMELADIAR